MTKENLKGKSAVGKNLRRKSVFRYALIGQGIIIGVTTGLIIALFRWLLIFADGCRNRLVAYANTGVGPALIAALVMLLLVLVIGWILRKEPESTGSGIPQVEAELLGKKDMNWLSVLVPKSWAAPCPSAAVWHWDGRAPASRSVRWWERVLLGPTSGC